MPKGAPGSFREIGLKGPGTAKNSDKRFRPSDRIPKAADFEVVFAASERSTDALFTVLFRRSTSPQARLGLAIPKKRIREAVGRNRLRRLIRESFRASKDKLGGLDVVVIAREAARQAENSRVFASLQDHWGRLQQAQARRG